jgi:hypothetical protein
MLQYIYFVKCPDCEDEHFDFFNDAKDFALGCLSKKPIITQIEVDRNDFGECVDSHDLGTIWSWEDMMKDTESKADDSCSHVLCKADLEDIDSEFDDLDNSVDFNPEISDEGLEEWINPSSSHGPYVIKVKNNADGYNYEGNGGRSLVRIDSNALSVFNSYDAAMKAKMGYKNPKSVEIVLLTDEQKLVECRKPIPEGMTIEQLVEEMEENEDTVECTWCEDLFDKSECRYEVDLGWLCSRCEMAIKSRGETLTFRENSYWDFLDEEVASEEPLAEAVAFNPQDTIELHYDKIKVSIVTREIPATYWEPADYEEETVTDYFDYEVKIDDVATVLWENFLTDEDVADVPGGFDTLEDEDAWYKYLAEHFDDLVEKYNKELLDYYEESAKEAAQEKFQDEYDNYEPEYFYDESLNIGKSKSMLEELEDSETYRSRLGLCPECDTHSFDNETGICIKCGFN